MVTSFQSSPLDIGRVVSRTFAAFGGNFFTFFLLALLFGGLPSVGLQYVLANFVAPAIYANVGPGSAFQMQYGLITIASGLALLLPAYILIGAITKGALVYFNGGRAGFGECLSTGTARLLPLVGLGLLSTLGIGLGFIVFIVPGIMLATKWVAAAPAMVAENAGVMDSFARSSELVRDNRWRIFWVFVIWIVLSSILQFVVGSVMGLSAGALVTMGDGATWVLSAFDAVVTALSNMVGAIGAAALYSELRTVKEGATSEQLASVFE